MERQLGKLDDKHYVTPHIHHVSTNVADITKSPNFSSSTQPWLCSVYCKFTGMTVLVHQYTDEDPNTYIQFEVIAYQIACMHRSQCSCDFICPRMITHLDSLAKEATSITAEWQATFNTEKKSRTVYYKAGTKQCSMTR